VLPVELAVLGLIVVAVIAPILIIRRQSSAVQSKLERYAATPPTSPKLPPEVESVYGEAKARAIAIPRDAQAIALDYRQQVPPPYRENLVRLVYFSAGCAQGMSPLDAIRYATEMWARTKATGDESQPLAG
jgi:hypothetical protein